jgi:hypothetical protein
LIFICFTGTSLVEIEIETVWLEAENATLMLPATPPRKLRRKLPGLSVPDASPEAL